MPAKPPAAAPAAAPSPQAPAAQTPPAATPPATASGDTVKAGGLTFAVPAGWKSVPPSNSMRAAELVVADPSGDASKNCTVAFSMARGDVQSNIDRWSGQVRDAAGQPTKANVTKRQVAGETVHIAEMTGAFSPGMGDTRTLQNWTMRGAIVELPGDMLFIKMTGPAEQMAAAAKGFDQLIDSAKK